MDTCEFDSHWGLVNIDIRVASHNLGGGTTNGTGDYSTGLAPVGTVKRLTQSSDVDIITLQECLKSEYDKWKYAGWSGVFVAMTTADENKFRGGEDKGLAILSRWPILDYNFVALPTPLVMTKKEFCLAEVRFDHPAFALVKENLWVATTHLWSAGLDPEGETYPGIINDATRNRQAFDISEYIDPRLVGSRRYILTGDFNTGPRTDPIDHLHRLNLNGSVGNTAKLWEADQNRNGTLQRSGRPTVEGRKIDYWFASHKGVDPLSGIGLDLIDAAENGGDKHDKILLGSARFTGLTPV